MYLAKSLAEKLYLFQVRMELHAGKWGKPVLRELGGGQCWQETTAQMGKQDNMWVLDQTSQFQLHQDSASSP